MYELITCLRLEQIDELTKDSLGKFKIEQTLKYIYLLRSMSCM